MSVNLKMDGQTYENATGITVGGKVINIEEIGGGGGTSDFNETAVTSTVSNCDDLLKALVGTTVAGHLYVGYLKVASNKKLDNLVVSFVAKCNNASNFAGGGLRCSSNAINAMTGFGTNFSAAVTSGDVYMWKDITDLVV